MVEWIIICDNTLEYSFVGPDGVYLAYVENRGVSHSGRHVGIKYRIKPADV